MKKVEIELPDGMFAVLKSDIDKHLEGVSVNEYVEFLVISHIIQCLQFFKEKDPWKKY